MVIYLDMDGTIADLYNPEVWEDKLFKMRNGLPGVFDDLESMVDFEKINALVYCGVIEVVIITWLPMDLTINEHSYGQYVKEKIQWLEEKFQESDMVKIFLPYGTPKEPVRGRGILFDDNREVRKTWGKGAYSNKALMPFINKLYNAIY